MYEIVKYNNYLNSLNLKNFTAVDLNFFTTICAKIKEKKFDEVTITFDEIKKMSKYKSLNKERFSEEIIRMNNKLMSSIIMNVQLPSGAIATFSLFSYFVTDTEKENVRVKVNKDWYFIFNELTSNFTQFELNEFVSLNNKYAKILFKLLKQYKSTGIFICDIENFRKYLDIPKTYSNKYIMDKIIKPALEKLKPYFKRLKVTPIYQKKPGQPLQGYKFTFTKTKELEEQKNKIETKKEQPKQKINKPKKNKFNDFTQSNYSDRFYELVEMKMIRGLTEEEQKEYEEELRKARR